MPDELPRDGLVAVVKRDCPTCVLAAPVLDEPLLRRAKRAGLSDAQLAALRPELAGEDGVRALRHRLGLRPVYKTVDTCAAEFGARAKATSEERQRIAAASGTFRGVRRTLVR